MRAKAFLLSSSCMLLLSGCLLQPLNSPQQPLLDKGYQAELLPYPGPEESPDASEEVSPEAEENGLTPAGHRHNPSECQPEPIPANVKHVKVSEPRFGVKADGVSDDTAALQAVFSFAKSNQVTHVIFEPRAYLITSVSVPPGLTLMGNCATLLMKKRASGWTRLFNVPGTYAYSSTQDSPVTRIRGFTFDGQMDLEDFTPETVHQAGIFATADPAKPGKIKFEVENCHFRNLYGDGIYSYNQTDAKIKRISADEVYRCVVCVSGVRNRVVVENLHGLSKKTLFDTEPSVDSGDVSASNILELRDAELSRLDLYLPGNSTFLGEKLNIVASEGLSITVVGGQGGQAIIRDSTVRLLPWSAIDIKRPNKLTRFENTTFILDYPNRSPTDVARAFTLIGMQWRETPNQRFEVIDSRFQLTSEIRSDDSVSAITLYPGTRHENNLMTLDGVTVPEGFDTVVDMKFGGVVRIFDSILAPLNIVWARYRDAGNYLDYFFDIEVARSGNKKVSGLASVPLSDSTNRCVIDGAPCQ